MKVFFQGALNGAWASGWQRCETLRGLVEDVVPFCQSAWIHRAAPTRWKRLLNLLQFDSRVVDDFNRVWLRAVLDCRPDVAWIEWPKLLRRQTLAVAHDRLPQCRFVAFYDDNPFGDRADELWQWQLFLETIPDFDLHLVKRADDILELRSRGARRAELFMHGCFEALFYPHQQRSHWAYPVSFVGTALDHRVPFVRELIVRERIPLHVFGNRWERAWFSRFRKNRFHSPVLGRDYVDVIRDSRISLAFVSSSNRDEYTMRTFEIPACMGFLFAERTPTHQSLFKEGVEAEFFSSIEECADKARFYLLDEAARNRVATGGFARCVASDYSLRRRMQDALKVVASLPARSNPNGSSKGKTRLEPAAR